MFGIATKYAESFIAVKYRVKTEDGRMQGGAMYALERGLNMKWLCIFRGICILWNRMCVSGQRDRGDLRDEFPNSKAGRWDSGRQSYSDRDLWRDQVYRKSM